MLWIKPVITTALTIIAMVLLNTRFDFVPPIGQFMNPFGGFWVNAESMRQPKAEYLNLADLKGKVEVLLDNNLVPHIFAANTHDLYFAQGYVTARHRLWQMELLTYLAAGRLSEIFGEATLEVDRYYRRMGIGYGAQKSLEAMTADPITREVLEAYSAGVNTYISGLSPAQYPLEYKLLGYQPEAWTTLKCVLLLKQMAMTLSSSNDDRRLTNILYKYGYTVMQQLFPNHTDRMEPIVPVGTPWNFRPIPIPKRPKGFLAGPTHHVTPYESNPGTGSNNWAISSHKSATGYPMLANDPHLDLTLPSTWYQVQLVGPGVNVYGVSLPGAPNVIIGFNERVAWGVTNVGSDVLDWYQIKFRNAARNEYWYEEQWKPIRKVIEKIKVLNQPTIFDTVRYTHHGPIVYEEGSTSIDPDVPSGHALRWVAHEPSNEFLAFYKLNRAFNYDDYVEALTHYASPAQNFVFASVDNDIAIWSNGKLPLKWKEQGKYILDGSTGVNDWQGWIPQSQNPHVKNPPRGFVSSANQFPADTSYPYYLDWSFDSYERAVRINEKLSIMYRATVDSMRVLQNDNFNLFAQEALPLLLPNVRLQGLNKVQRKALHEVRTWNWYNDSGQVGATIFTLWWDAFMTELWEDNFPDNPAYPVRYPTKDRTLQLILEEPNSRWVDNLSTKSAETLKDLCTKAFTSAVDTLLKYHGPGINEKWQWGRHKNTMIPHLSRLIKSFGRDSLNTGGGIGIVNATSEQNGPSWRMVVTLGPQVKGYGVYPGGQSGNPGSYYYDNMVDAWVAGKLNELMFLQKVDSQHRQILSKWEMINDVTAR